MESQILPKKINWTIKRINPAAVKIIKDKAKKQGYTIPQYIEYSISCLDIEQPLHNSDKSWTIKGLDKQTIQTIKNNAANENKSVANYIKGLLSLKRTVVRQDRVKANLKRQVKEGVERIFKELDSSES
jgi:hypothetical protein